MYRYASSRVSGSVARCRAEGQEGPAEQFLREGSGGCLGLLEFPDEVGVRHDLVRRVRQEIAAGTYDTPEKLEIAFERLADRLVFA